MTLAVLAVFVPTFIFVSATPGMCMTLALTLGITIGVRRALWMMIGELTAVSAMSMAASDGSFFTAFHSSFATLPAHFFVVYRDYSE